MTNESNPQILCDFYDYTHLCIGIFNFKEDLICDCPGCPRDCSLIQMEYNKNIHLVLEKLYITTDSLFAQIEFSTKNGLQLGYSACYVNPNNKNSGCYVFGPYLCQKDDSSSLPYLPEFAISHTVDMLYTIAHKYIASSKQLSQVPNYHLNKISIYINDNYQNAITLNDLSTSFGLNPAYLCRLFKKETGHTFTEFLNNIRIEKSIELLLTTNQSISQVGTAVGFNSQSYYCRQFKKLIGISPSEYRSTKK